jgi:hypothetical protein
MHIRYEILFAVLGIPVALMAARIIRLIAMTAGLEKNLCPCCGSLYIKNSSPRSVRDFPFPVFGLHPFRCTICETRFFAFRAPADRHADSRGVRRNVVKTAH